MRLKNIGMASKKTKSKHLEWQTLNPPGELFRTGFGGALYNFKTGQITAYKITHNNVFIT